MFLTGMFLTGHEEPTTVWQHLKHPETRRQNSLHDLDGEGSQTMSISVGRVLL